MKPKKIGKKLVLNKSTIASLDTKRMKYVYGGDTGLELCTERPLLCDTAQCPPESVEETCLCSGHATCGEFTCYPPFSVCAPITLNPCLC